jgi:hypothetical protein
MSLIEIPLKVVLDTVLDELELPRSTSETQFMTDEIFTITVMLYLSNKNTCKPQIKSHSLAVHMQVQD